MRGDARAHTDADFSHARHLAGGRHEQFAQQRVLAEGRVAQLQLKSDVAAIDLQTLDGFGADKVLACVGVQHGLQGVQNGLGGDR